MISPLTTQEFCAKALAVHGLGRYDYSKSVYVRSQVKVCILCLEPEHGEFWQTPNNHLNGKGCPECAGLKRLTQESFLRRAVAVHANRYNYSQTAYQSIKADVCIVCPVHGPFLQAPDNHLRNHGCPACVGLDRLTQEEFLVKAHRAHNGRYDYSKAVVTSNTTKLCIVCPIHGEFWQAPKSHLKGYGCADCAGNKQRDPALFAGMAVAVHGEKYDYSQAVYTNTDTKLVIICRQHGPFEQTPYNHVNLGKGCASCSNVYSKPHKEVESYLTSLGVVYLSNSRSIIPPKELDIYLPAHNLAVEFNGTFWHSIDEFDSPGDKLKHRNKFLSCQTKGIRLLQISEHEWSDPRTQSIWQSVLASKLGKHIIKVSARKTTFRAITRYEANTFLATNHLQGGTPYTRFCFGLFLKETLIGVITFAYHEKQYLNLSRLAFPLNTTVVGGAQKLFKNALKALPALPVITFSHNQYSGGAVYETLGFRKDGDLSASYQWVFQGEILNKRLCRHSRLAQLLGDQYDPSLTEHQNMYRAGARCLYDAGYQRWVYELHF